MAKDTAKSDSAADKRTDTATGDAPQTGGVTSHDESVNVPHDVFATSGSEPVRDKTADESKGTPVTRYFTKDGTPVEPSTLPPNKTPANLAGFDHEKADVIAAVEYVDENGSTVTHDSLKAAKERK